MPKETQPKASATPANKLPQSEQDQSGHSEPTYKYATRSAPPDDTYADGAASIAGGRSVVKLDLYRVVGFDKKDKKEVRTISHRLVLPLTALPELMKLMQGYGQAVQQISRASKKQADSNGKS